MTDTARGQAGEGEALRAAAEVLRLAKKAAPGPWTHGPREAEIVELKRQHWAIGVDGGIGVAFGFGATDDNAALIAYCREAAPLLARALLAQQPEGWVTVTDSPETWPKDCADIVLIEWVGKGNSIGHMLQSRAARHCSEGPDRTVARWMPWPTAPGASRAEADRLKALIREWVEAELAAEAQWTMAPPAAGSRKLSQIQQRADSRLLAAEAALRAEAQP